jgi:hypothetical protein
LVPIRACRSSTSCAAAAALVVNEGEALGSLRAH